MNVIHNLAMFNHVCAYVCVCILMDLYGILQETELRNQHLESQLHELEQRLESSQCEQESFRRSLRSLLELLDGKIFELTELRDSLVKLI